MKCICRHKEEDHKLNSDFTRGACQHKEPVTKKKCRCKKFECGHWRIKRNYPFGKNSTPTRVCKDCGEIVTSKFLRARKLR